MQAASKNLHKEDWELKTAFYQSWMQQTTTSAVKRFFSCTKSSKLYTLETLFLLERIPILVTGGMSALSSKASRRLTKIPGVLSKRIKADRSPPLVSWNHLWPLDAPIVAFWCKRIMFNTEKPWACCRSRSYQDQICSTKKHCGSFLVGILYLATKH